MPLPSALLVAGLAIGVAMTSLMPTRASAGGHPKPAWVSGSVARLRQAPDQEAAISARLRIGTEVRILQTRGAWAEVKTAIGERGYLKRSLLASTPPRLEALLARADRAGSPKGSRTWLERATAYAPGDRGVIRRLIDNYRALGRHDAAWSVEKGLIAAERRELSWDGPLYPIVADVVWLPSPCPADVTARTRDEALAKRPKPAVPVLRARAFPLVNSGKVVAITEQGNKTRVLDAPVCLAGPCGTRQAGFALEEGGGEGVLAPSWLVAGFRVEGYRRTSDLTGEKGAEPPVHRYEDEAGRTRIDVEGQRYTLSVRGFDGWRPVGTWPLLRPGARPVAQASEHERGMLLFWRGQSARACCASEVEAWAERVDRLDEEQPVHQAGRVYSQGWLADCPQSLFSGLEGEPRCERLPGGCNLDEPRPSDGQ